MTRLWSKPKRNYSRFTSVVAALAFSASVFAGAARAADGPRTERVHFKAGASSAVVESSITGYESIDYVLGARAGQSMNVSMATKHGATYFNILAPGENETAMFNGSVDGNQYEGTLPASGDYKVRVYMMRSAARRKEHAKFRLEMLVTNGAKPAAPNAAYDATDAKVPGTDFHATGDVPCSMGTGQARTSCPFGVKREGGGSGTVTITKPDGRKRIVFFEKGKATGSDASAADPGEFRASRDGDTTVIHIGDERYEIPDAVIQGG